VHRGSRSGIVPTSFLAWTVGGVNR
jgi:hypothetical protein